MQGAQESLKAKLESLYESDLAERLKVMPYIRKNDLASPAVKDLLKAQSERDAKNMEILDSIIEDHGWPRKVEVGEKGIRAAFMVIQHANLTYQKKYLPLIVDAVERGEMAAKFLAMLKDRIRIGEGKPQIYGTQLKRNDLGHLEPHPIENENNVHNRRKVVGLQPLQDYLNSFNTESSGRKPQTLAPETLKAPSPINAQAINIATPPQTSSDQHTEDSLFAES